MSGIGKPDFVTGVDRIVREEEADKAQRAEVPAGEDVPEDVVDGDNGDEREEAEAEEADGGEGGDQGELF